MKKIKTCVVCGINAIKFVGNYCSACSSRKYRQAKWDKLPKASDGHKACVSCKSLKLTLFLAAWTKGRRLGVWR